MLNTTQSVTISWPYDLLRQLLLYSQNDGLMATEF